MVTKVKAEETITDAEIDAGKTDGTEMGASNNAGPGQTTGSARPVATEGPGDDWDKLSASAKMSVRKIEQFALGANAVDIRKHALTLADAHHIELTRRSGQTATAEMVVARAKVYLAFLAGDEA